MRIRKNIRYFVLVVTLLAMLGSTAFAAALIDPQRNTSLTICYDIDKAPISGVEFKLYCVAEISSDGVLTPAGDFADYAASFDGLTSEGWTDLTKTLQEYVLEHQLIPAMRGKTDKNGRLSFPDCPQGLYLLVGEKHIYGDKLCTPQSLLVSLPSMKEDGSWEYDVTSEPKFSDGSDSDFSDSGFGDPGSGKPGTGNLPQTGMLLWPIPVTLILGTVLLLTGCWFRKKYAPGEDA